MMNKFGKQLAKFLELKCISVNEFADRIGTTPKTLIEILKGKIAISQNMIYNISFVTGISAQYIENVENSFKNHNMIDEFLNSRGLTISKYINLFNYKEFSKLYDYKFRDERNKYDVAEDILRYLRLSSPETIYKEDNSIFYKSKNDKPELKALWLEHCYRTVLKQEINVYTNTNITNLVSFIRNEALHNHFNKNKLIKEFNKNGIYLAIEPDLKGSKIRGAFKVLVDKPAIYITLKHRRIADIYFALFHELAHCKSDFNRAKNGSLISDYDDGDKEEFELKADNTALNWMVDDSSYEIIKKDLSNIGNEIPSFVAYRLALDGLISYNSTLYQTYNFLIDD